MCGIFGLAGPRYSEPSRERQARQLYRRGPDGFGQHVDDANQVYLAHTRLAIIDPTPRGAQPMCNEDGTVWITFNGEIYDHAALRAELELLGHRFASATDSEVIVHAYEQWGIDCLSRLSGMFAFGLWDSKSNKLFLVRDRLGIKPIYYGVFDGTLAFASDARVLVGLPFVARELAPSALTCYLLYKYVSGEQSIWKDVRRLLPGHLLEFDATSRSACTRRYWKLPLEEQAWRAEDALERFSELFSNSVRDCLVSDVPVIAFLSGGYDSSAVVCAAGSLNHNINTYSIGFAGWERDERAAAQKTATQLGTAHFESVLGPEHFTTVDEVIGAYDEPLADSSIFPTYLLCREARTKAKVALSGDGGDELLGGYTWYRQTVRTSVQKRLAFMLEPLLMAMGMAQTNLGQRSSPVSHYRMLTSPTFSIAEIAKLFPSLPSHALPDEEGYLYRSHLRAELTGYRRWQFVDLNTFLVDSNLAKVDRASMAHGLEVRVPFLDHRLAEFAFSLPLELTNTRHQHKVLLARWLQAHGMGEVLDRPKQGFSSPWQTFWPTRTMAAELEQGWLVSSGLANRRELQKFLDSSTPQRGLQLLVLATLDRWGRQWVR